jgi:hypothetical protein
MDLWQNLCLLRVDVRSDSFAIIGSRVYQELLKRSERRLTYRLGARVAYLLDGDEALLLYTTSDVCQSINELRS